MGPQQRNSFGGSLGSMAKLCQALQLTWYFRSRILAGHLLRHGRDRKARDGRGGGPVGVSQVTGQPAFDQLADAAKAEIDAALALKRELEMDNGRPTLVFIGEALQEHWLVEYGYDERTCLNCLLEMIKDLPERPNLIVKKHPQNVDEDFDLEVIRRLSERLVIRIIGMEHPARRVVLAADVVVGMSSVLLVESILLGKITVSMEIGARVFNKCFPVDIGAIPLLIEKERARSAVSNLVSNPASRAEWRSVQSKLKHIPGSSAAGF